ncbi:hypothetical protein RJ639_031588 [Escallonia herrerae]|uniref:Histidine kinase domain-containing protein n=1 Tax=Escallonia herrerae TaxID=1293975 RepID=A0AA88X0M8_9ASTE|nr:hypothetical protein RJ639_031588 [Escallonia herrerae]
MAPGVLIGFKERKSQWNMTKMFDCQRTLGRSSKADLVLDARWYIEKGKYISDFFIAVAYFSIPLELIYFVQKSAFFPYRWVLMQFGAFIVLCGATHFINLWTFSMHSKTVAVVMNKAKVSTAVVSCATALMLVHIIPDLFSVKKRERLLKGKAEELDRERGLIIKQEETGRHVRMLTREIRSTLVRHTILKTTLVELGRTLELQECALWMPSRRGSTLQLSHTLNNLIPYGSNVPMSLPIVNEVFNSADAIRVPHTCPLARTRPPLGIYAPPEAVQNIFVLFPLAYGRALVQQGGPYLTIEWAPSSNRPYPLLRPVIHVKDSGCGIMPQDIPHLFTKFSESHNASSTWRNGGAGLGLAICKSSVVLVPKTETSKTNSVHV